MFFWRLAAENQQFLLNLFQIRAQKRILISLQWYVRGCQLRGYEQNFLCLHPRMTNFKTNSVSLHSHKLNTISQLIQNND